MTIKQSTLRGVRILIGLVAFAIIVAGISIREISMGGPLHKEGQMQSDLVADILPPPEYIIEPFLETTIAVKDEQVDLHVARLAELRKQYEERKAYWQTSELDAALKAQMAVANTSADAFWTEVEGSFIPALQRGDFAGADAIHTSSLTQLYKAHRADIDQLVVMAGDAQKKLADHSSLITYASVGALLLVAGALIFFINAAGLRLRRQVIDPIDETSEEMRRMASGDFNVHIHGAGRDDEIGQMASAMKVFRETGIAKAEADAKQQRVVADLDQGLSQLSAGNMTYRINEPFAPEYEGLRTSFNSTMNELSVTLGHVTASAANVDTGAVQIRSAADDLSMRTEQQAAALEETAAAINQTTELALSTAQARAGVRHAIDEAEREAGNGGAVVEKAVAAMGAIEHSAQEITQIIDVIDGIAFQTNLLALNAGVEAARAGDAGKGFAVVANEVRALAQRSADAANDIKKLITTSAQQVENGVALVGETGSVLSTIVTRVGEVSQLINDIANSSDTQARNMEQVNGSVHDMDKMTQQNAAMVEETTAAARSLASEAQSLKQLVSRFQLGGAMEKPRSAGSGKAVPAKQRQSAPMAAGNLALSVDEDDWDDF
ncbi:MAG: HAMP domain-containing methyl-accepting chemotaxis protein [Sphingobium sp.]|nr:HAMP domain-containing protein [Sphingobium sp.]MCP5398560.1 HAMP domain-containing protein [Sphingomonas sp.]